MEEKEFTPITTQEALDSVIKDRLNRQSDKHSKELEAVKSQFADYDALKSANADYENKLNELNTELSKANEKVKGYDSQIAELNAKVKAYESLTLKQEIVKEFDLAADAIDFLNGENEEELRAAAEKLQKLAPRQRVAPLAGGSNENPNSKTQALKSMLSNLN